MTSGIRSPQPDVFDKAGSSPGRGVTIRSVAANEVCTQLIRRKDMRSITTFGLAVVFGMSLLASAAGAADPAVTLMLGGKFCEFYPKEITEGLMAVKGVQ